VPERATATRSHAVKRDQLLVVGILVFIAVLFLLAFHLPHVGQIRGMKEDLKQQREALRQDHQTAQNLHRLALEVRDLRDVTSHLDEQLPSTEGLDQFLKELAVCMAAESLELLGLKPEAVQKGQQLDELPIQVGFRGTFAGTYRFLRRLESMRRIARVDALQLTVSEGTGPNQLSGTMRLCVYVLRPSEADKAG